MINKIGIGYSPLTDKVYLGKQNKAKQMWIGDKKEITNDFLAVAYAYFEENKVRTISAGEETNIFLNIKKDKASITKAIKHLTKLEAILTKIKNEG